MKRSIKIILGVYSVAIMLLAWLAMTSLHHFAEIEHEEVTEDVLQARSLLESQIAQLGSTADEYAARDEIIQLLHGNNLDFITNNLNDVAFSKQRLNLICLVNANGSLVYGSFRQPEASSSEPLPSTISRHIFPNSSLLATPPSSTRLKGGFLALPEGIMMIAARSVLSGASSELTRGTLVIGRFLDIREVERISSSAQLNMHVQSLGSANAPEILKLLEQLPANDSVVANILSAERLRGYSRLTDIFNNPAGLVSLDKTRHAYLQAGRIVLILTAFSATVFSCVAFVLFKLSNKLTIINQSELNSNQQLKTFVELAVDGIFKLDGSGRILDANLQAAALTGYTQDELYSMRFDELFSEAETVQNPIDQRLLSAGLAVTVRRMLTRKGEVAVPVEIRCKYLPDRTCQCIMQDRTEQMYWEEKLHQHQELLNGIINGTSDIIYAKDLDCRYLLINNAGLKFAEKTKGNILGLEDKDVFSPETAQTLRQADRLAICSDEVTTSEDTITGPNGTKVIFLATRGPLVDKNGTTTGLFAILHDITVRTMLEKELLEQHNRLGQLAVKISLAEEQERVRIAEELHDQVGPNLLLGKMKLDMLQARLTEDTLIAACETIDALLSQSVKDIRSLTLQLRPPILANAGLEAALKWLVQEYDHKYGLQIVFEDDGQQKPLKYEKRTILFQVVRELLLNITKHAKSDSARILLERTGRSLRLIVADNGTGFKPQVDTATIPPSGGFGLFNVTQKLKHIHSSLAIDSYPGKGTSVTITAPLDEQQPGEPV